MDKIIALPIIISILFLSVSFFLVSIKLNNWIKFFSILTLNLLGFFIWFIIPQYMGFATVVSLPDKWVLVWANINKPYYIEILIEPYDSFDNKSNILSYRTDNLEKRFYRCEYNEEFDKALSENIEKVQNGIKVVFSREKSSVGSGHTNGTGSRGGLVVHDELPPGRMLEK